MHFVKQNPITMAAIALAVIGTVGVLAYAQSQQSALERKHLEADSKLSQAVEDSSKKNKEREAKLAAEKKAAEEAAAKKAAEEKAAAEAAAAAEAEKQQQYTYYEEKKKQEQPSYEIVQVSLSRSGGSVVAWIGTTKPGTCYFTFKNYTDPNNPVYTSTESAAANNGCSSAIPAGTWTHAAVTYKASDYSAKGYSDKIAL